MQKQCREQRALLRAAHGHDAPAVDDLQRAEDPEFHAPPSYHVGARSATCQRAESVPGDSPGIRSNHFQEVTMKARSLTVATVAAAALALAGSAAADVYSIKPADVYSVKPGDVYSLKPGDVYSVKPGDVYRARAHRAHA